MSCRPATESILLFLADSATPRGPDLARAVIYLWELSEKNIRGLEEVNHDNAYFGFEALYREAKRRNPDYVSFWKRERLVTPQ